ncbi:hypothetical protein FRC00_008618, partial [Tulasnella sp. 408]
SLRSIEIYGIDMSLGDFTELVEEYLSKSSKPLPEEIVLINYGAPYVSADSDCRPPITDLRPPTTTFNLAGRN